MSRIDNALFSGHRNTFLTKDDEYRESRHHWSRKWVIALWQKTANGLIYFWNVKGFNDDKSSDIDILRGNVVNNLNFDVIKN